MRRLTAALHTMPEQVLAGAGHDCAVLQAPPGGYPLFKTDAMVEGVHFTWEMGPELVGRKALCRVLSDFAAAGGRPWAALVTVGASGSLPMHLLEAAYSGLNAAARQFQCSIAGGELTSTTGPCWFSVSAVGYVSSDQYLLRSGGQPGDVLHVTGRLGGSLASGRHLTFTPRLAQGTWLAERHVVSAMMDLSDGLGTDLPRLAHASGVGFQLDLDALPVHPGISTQQALGDGEDYELLFAVPAALTVELERDWPAAFPDVLLTRIGKLTELPAGAHNQALPTHEHPGYTHFQQPG